MVESAQQRAMRSSAGIAAAGAVGVAALTKLGAASLKAAADVQATRTGFATLLGSAERARKLYSDIEKFSLTSPLNNAETAKAAQLLLATGTAGDKVIGKLHAIGNAAAAAGGGQDRFNGILMAMAKLENRSVASRMQLNQIGLRGVEVTKILQRELGLTADQVADIGHQGLSGAKVAEALYRGMDKIGGGKAMENLNKTYLGQLSMMNDSADQLKARFGELILPDATAFVGGLASALSYTRDLVKMHPRLAKGAFYGAGAASVGAVAYGTIRTIQLATLARKALEKAVKSDAAAEVTKTGIAGKEGAAIGGVGNAAAGTATKLGILARTGAFLRGPLSIGGRGFQTSAAFGGRGALGGLGAQGGAKTMGMVTTGGALMSAALGAAAGYQAASNMKAAGYTEGQSYMYGAATGIGAAGAAMFLPGGAVAVALGMAGAALVNKFYNEPLERKAELGSGAENTDVMGAGMQGKLEAATKAHDRGALEAVYRDMSKKAAASGDTVSAESFSRQADIQKDLGSRENTRNSPEYLARLAREAAPGLEAGRRRAALETTPEAMAAYRNQSQDAANAMLANRKREAEMRAVVGPEAHGGGRTITLIIPPSRADEQTRRNRSNTMTPAPV